MAHHPPLTRAAQVALVILSTTSAVAGEPEHPEYVVRAGDTLSLVAERMTGDRLRYPEFAALNGGALRDPSRLEVGVRLRLPEGWAPQPPPAAGAAPAAVAADDLWSPDVLTPVPRSDPEEELHFLPALAELDRLFRELTVRAAYLGDLAWAGQVVDELQAQERERVEQIILDREQAVQARRAQADACAAEAARAEAILRGARATATPELLAEEERLKATLFEAILAEQAVWELRFEGELDEDGLFLWRSFLESLPNGDWVRTAAWHRALAPYRVAFIGRFGEASEADRLAASGTPVVDAIDAIVKLMQQDSMRRELVDRQRFQAALAQQREARDCSAALVDAEILLEQAQRKRLLVQRILNTGDGDALQVDAERVAARYAGVLQDLRYVDRFFPSEMWTALWWKAGVAWRLAGEHAQGQRALLQAVAVSKEQRLPVGQLPPQLDVWLREAELTMAQRMSGRLVVEVPGTATLTVDGREVRHTFGLGEVELPPGLHRVVVWVDGSRPMARLVSVVEGEDARFAWWEQPPPGEHDDVLGERYDLEALPHTEPPRRWRFSLGAQAGTLLGKAVLGGSFTIRYLPASAGVELSLGALAPTTPMWLPDQRDLRLFGRARLGALGAWRPGVFHLAGGGGVWVDPGLSFGPYGSIELSWRVKGELRVGVGLRAGYDVTPHFDVLPRHMLDGEVSLWF